jgi:ADP-heptose:LPS heptosyltransferase
MAAGGAEEIPRLASPPLDLLSALLARSAAYIGGDSGVTHLAALSGAPTLGLLGPASDPGRWAPIGPRAGWISWERASKGVGLLMRLAGDFS